MTREDGKHINPASTYNGGIKQQLEFSNKSRNPQNLGRDAKKSIRLGQVGAKHQKLL